MHHALTRSRKGLANARAQTMMPLIRNVLFVAILIIALIVALANMGMNVTPLLAGAGVIGLAIKGDAQARLSDQSGHGTGGFPEILEDTALLDVEFNVAAGVTLLVADRRGALVPAIRGKGEGEGLAVFVRGGHGLGVEFA